MTWRSSCRPFLQALKSGLLTQLAAAPSPPDTSCSHPAANEAAASAAVGSAAADEDRLASRGREAAGAADSGLCGQECSAEPQLSVQGRQISLQRQPPRTPARVSAPAAPLPLSRLGPLQRGQAAGVEHLDVFVAGKAAAGLNSTPGTASAKSVAQAAAPSSQPGSIRTPATKRQQPAAGRLSIAERATAVLETCTTDADRRVSMTPMQLCWDSAPDHACALLNVSVSTRLSLLTGGSPGAGQLGGGGAHGAAGRCSAPAPVLRRRRL